MGKPQDNQDSNSTEQRILQAAEREFMEKGFAGARTTSIAQAAGVTHAMFHYYFRTKERLFDRIITEKISLLREILLSSVGDASLPLEQIVWNVVDKHLDFIDANPDLPRFLVGEIFSDPERAKVLLDTMRSYGPVVARFIQHKIDLEVERGNCRPVDAKMLMLDLVSLNVLPYMVAPAVNAAMEGCMEDRKRFLEQRKLNNYETLMRKLKP